MESQRSQSWLGSLMRGLAWMVSICTIVVLAFICQQWPNNGSVVAASLIGTIIALLNDSWQMLAASDRFISFIPLPPGRLIAHDALSLTVCASGLGFIMFIGLRNNDDIGTFFTQDGLNGETISHINDYKFEYTEKSMLMQAVWFLLAVVAFRIIFVLWAGYDCLVIWRQMNARQPRRVTQPYTSPIPLTNIEYFRYYY